MVQDHSNFQWDNQMTFFEGTKRKGGEVGLELRRGERGIIDKNTLVIVF